MKIRIRIALLAVTLSALFASLAAFGQEAPIVPAHVIGFEMNRDGVIEPFSHFIRNRRLDPRSEEELAAVVATERANSPGAKGHIAVRALDGNGKILYRTVVEVVLVRSILRDEGEDHAPIEHPVFTAIAPAEASSISLEGWQPASRVTFDLREIEAKWGEPKRSSKSGMHTDAVTPQITLTPNRFNILVLGDGYVLADGQDVGNTPSLFKRDVANMKNTILGIHPISQYNQFVNFTSYFEASVNRGAKHPTCAVNAGLRKECDPKEGQTPSTHSTIFASTYCSGGLQRSLVADDRLVTAKVNAIISGDAPDAVVVLVNDSPHGGTGGTHAVFSARLPFYPNDPDPWLGYLALHEIGHLLGLSDEYEYGGLVVGPRPTCTNDTTVGSGCGPNVLDFWSKTTTPTLNDLAGKWARWVDTVTPAIPLCTDAQQFDATGTRLTTPCTHLTANPVGLYEGGGFYRTQVYRPELNCLMRNLAKPGEFCDAQSTSHTPNTLTTTPPSLCHLCSDEVLRKLYTKVRPIENIQEQNHTHNVIGLRNISPGLTIMIGADVLTKSSQPLTQTIKWRKNGVPDPTLDGKTRVPYTGVKGQTNNFEMIVTDTTPIIREKSGAHNVGFKAKPIHMTDSVTWYMASPFYLRAVTPQSTSELIQNDEITVSRGSTSLALKYGVTTQEPGASARPGDSWSITLAYGGSTATAATASAPLFFDQNIIKSTGQNFSRSLTVPVDASTGDVKVVVTLRIRNLEESDFAESAIEAEIFSDGIANCDAQCEICRLTPSTPGCPAQLQIQSAAMLPLESDANDAGPGDFVSIAQAHRLDRGRHVQIQTTPMPANLASLRVTAKLMSLFGEELGVLRDTTWRPNQGRGGGAKGLEQTDTTSKWKFNVSQKKDFGDALPAIPEGQWLDAFKYRITMTLTTTDGLVNTQAVDVDRITMASPPFDRPLRALWEEPANTRGLYHKWVSIQTHRWFKQFSSLVNVDDRNTDEHGAYDTPPGHENANAFTELPYYPGADVYQNTTKVLQPFFNLRTEVSNLIYNGATTEAQKAATRAKLLQWVRDTRAHLTNLLPNDAVNYVRIGDGSYECISSGTDAVGPFLRELLEYGRYTHLGIVWVDLTTEPDIGTAQWQVYSGKLIWSCDFDFWPDVTLDRCQIGEFPGPCRTGRPPGMRITHITSQPAGKTINTGQAATLTVSADGEDLRYRWYAGPVGNFTESLRVDSGDNATVSVVPPETQQYWVYVWGGNGSEVSHPAVVQVSGTGTSPCSRPVITQQPPLFTTITPDETATLSVHAQGTNLRYQWFYSQSSSDTPAAIAFANQPDYSTSGAGRYTVRVSNSCGEQVSVGAYIIQTTSCQVPTVLSKSPDAMVRNGDSIDLFVNANGKAPLSYVWYENVPGAGSRLVGYAPTVRVRPTVNGTSYMPSISNECGSINGDPVAIIVCDPPAVTAQPPARNIVRGESTTLTVAASGSTPMTVVWTNANDSSNAGFGTTVTVAPLQTTPYFAQITNACGSTTSQSGTVTVCQPAAIASPPQGSTVTRGQPATLSVTAGGTGPFTYQWLANGTAIAGAAGSSATVTPLQSTAYQVVVTGSCGTATSAQVTVDVCFPPEITHQPQSTTALPGGTATLSVDASGTGPFTYRLVDQDSITIASGSSNTFEFTPPSGTRRYRIQVTGSCGNVWSDEAAVTTCQAPAISTQPLSQSVVQGDTATLSVVATGTAPLTYQWFQGATALPGETSPSLPVSPQSATSYSVTVTNACGSAPSNPATVTVTQRCFRPIISVHPLPATIAQGQSVTLTVTSSGTSPKIYTWYADGAAVGDTPDPSFTVSPAATTTYVVVITNDCGTATSNPATITVTSCGDVPVITTQPQPAAIQAGQSTTLSVGATGTDPLTYQWYANGSAINGATASSQSVSPATNTSYHVVVTGACGMATSNVVTVTVGNCGQPPSIASQPQPASIQQGQPVTLSVTASGTAPLSYQWFADGVSVPNGTGSSLTVSPSASTSYHVVVTGACGTATSNTVLVTVGSCGQSPSITAQPFSTTIYSGQSTTLGVGATGTSPLSYQWYVNGSPIPNETGATLTVSPASMSLYHVVITNACGTATSATATVTVQPCQPSITFQPQSISIAAGDSATLSVAADGRPPLAYQWFRGDGSPVPNGNGSSVTVTPATTTDYYVVVSNDCGSRTSNVARISIVACPAPTITHQPQDTHTTYNGGVTLSVTAAGQAPLSYRWYNGDAGDTTAPVYQTDGQIATGPSVTINPSTLDTTYWVRVSNACGTADSVGARVTMDSCGNVTITQQPQAVTITAGQSATLTVSATGTPLLFHQWFLGYAGDTSTPLDASPSVTVSPAVTTPYWVRVANACGVTYSSTAIVTVLPNCTGPSITQHPSNATINAGQAATLTVAASGSPAPSYQWYFTATDQPVSGGDGSSLTVSPAQTTTYYAVATSSCGTARSSDATVTVIVCDAPVVTSPAAPTALVLRIGNTKTLTVQATGSGPLSYQWFASEPEGTSYFPIAGANGTTLIVSPDMTSRYFVRVTNECGTVDSPYFRVMVWDGNGDPPGPQIL